MLNLQVNIVGRTPNYISLWSGPLNFSSPLPNINNLFSGTYNLNVVDTLGCNFDTSFFISQPDAYYADISINKILLITL